MSKRLTLAEFISKANEVHNNLYDYSKVVYKNNKTKVIIIDPIYGEFEQTPNSHLAGYGNPTRGFIKCNQTSNTAKFIEKARKIHGDFYDYSKVVYVNSGLKVCIIDPDYGEFWQLPSGHLQGYGNPTRGKLKAIQWQLDNNRLTNEEFIDRCKKVHGDFYDYSKVEYINSYTKVIIIDPEYGEFEMSPDQHMKGAPHPKRSIRSEFEIDHIIPLSIICSGEERKMKIHKERPLYKFLNSDINLQVMNSKANVSKSDKILVDGKYINCRKYRNDYNFISELVKNKFNIDIKALIEMDKEYVARII